MSTASESRRTSRFAAARSVERARRFDPASLVQLLAIVPILITVGLVRDSSQLMWLDYWDTVSKYIGADGSLQPRGLVYFHEGHVPVIGSLVFWINLKLFGGLAHPIGYFDIAVVVAQLLILRSFLPPPERLGRWWHPALVVAFALLLFAPQGAWNFARSASGASWLTANLFMIAAIAFATRGRYLWSALFAALASITYGTGLMAWPAVIVIAILRRGWNWKAWALVAAAVVTLATYAIAYRQPASQASLGIDLNHLARRTLQVFGSVLSPNPEVAPVAGAVGLALAGYLGFAAWRERELRDDALPWIGLAVWAILAGAMIGAARGGNNPDDLGVASRYASLSILLWVAVLALLVIRFGRDPRVFGAGFAITALAFSGGHASVVEQRASTLNQNELAIATRLGLSEGYPAAPDERQIPMFKKLGHYPFTSSFTADCGLLGKRIDPASVHAPSVASRGQLDRFEPPYNDRSARVAGWFGSDEGATRCVAITDEDLRVIGAASIGYERADLVPTRPPSGTFDLGLTGVADARAKEFRAFAVVDGRKGIYEVSGALTPAPPAQGRVMPLIDLTPGERIAAVRESPVVCIPALRGARLLRPLLREHPAPHRDRCPDPDRRRCRTRSGVARMAGGARDAGPPRAPRLLAAPAREPRLCREHERRLRNRTDGRRRRAQLRLRRQRRLARPPPCGGVLRHARRHRRRPSPTTAASCRCRTATGRSRRCRRTSHSSARPRCCGRFPSSCVRGSRLRSAIAFMCGAPHSSSSADSTTPSRPAMARRSISLSAASPAASRTSSPTTCSSSTTAAPRSTVRASTRSSWSTRS